MNKEDKIRIWAQALAVPFDDYLKENNLDNTIEIMEEWFEEFGKKILKMIAPGIDESDRNKIFSNLHVFINISAGYHSQDIDIISESEPDNWFLKIDKSEFKVWNYYREGLTKEFNSKEIEVKFWIVNYIVFLFFIVRCLFVVAIDIV